MQGAKWPTSDEIIGLAFEATSRAEFRAEVMRRLLACTGADFAVFSGVATPPEREEVLHLEMEVACASRLTYLELELERSPLMARAFGQLREHGDLIDTELYRLDEWERLPYVERYQRAYGVKSSMVVSWVSRSREPILLMVARTGRLISAEHAESARRLLRTLAVADASLGVAPEQHHSSLFEGLTARQQQIIEYLCLGYSNAEIASACGTSMFTVRNHLVRLFERFGVSTRTELALRLTGKHSTGR